MLCKLSKNHLLHCLSPDSRGLDGVVALPPHGSSQADHVLMLISGCTWQACGAMCWSLGSLHGLGGIQPARQLTTRWHRRHPSSCCRSWTGWPAWGRFSCCADSSASSCGTPARALQQADMPKCKSLKCAGTHALPHPVSSSFHCEVPMPRKLSVGSSPSASSSVLSCEPYCSRLLFLCLLFRHPLPALFLAAFPVRVVRAQGLIFGSHWD